MDVVAAVEPLPPHLLAPSPQQQQQLDAQTATETKQPKRRSNTDGQVLARQTPTDALDPLRGSQTHLLLGELGTPRSRERRRIEKERFLFPTAVTTAPLPISSIDRH